MPPFTPIEDLLGNLPNRQVGKLVDFASFVLFEQGGGEMVVTETAAALPVDGCGYAAFVCAVDDFLEAGDNVSMAMFAEFDLYPAATHFVCDCACGAGASEGVEDKISWVCGKLKNSP